MRRPAPILPCLAFSFALAGLAPASAQIASPQRKPGLWEMNMVNSTVKGMAIKSQMCTDATVEKRFSVLGGAEGPKNCTQSALRRTAAGFAFDSTCKSPGRVVVTSGLASGDFQSNYKVEMTSRMPPPPPGAPPSMTSTISARWLGPCPAGRKPGDIIMPNGMVINMLTMEAAKAPPAGPKP